MKNGAVFFLTKMYQNIKMLLSNIFHNVKSGGESFVQQFQEEDIIVQNERMNTTNTDDILGYNGFTVENGVAKRLLDKTTKKDTVSYLVLKNVDTFQNQLLDIVIKVKDYYVKDGVLEIQITKNNWKNRIGYAILLEGHEESYAVFEQYYVDNETSEVVFFSNSETIIGVSGRTKKLFALPFSDIDLTYQSPTTIKQDYEGKGNIFYRSEQVETSDLLSYDQTVTFDYDNTNQPLSIVCFGKGELAVLTKLKHVTSKNELQTGKIQTDILDQTQTMLLEEIFVENVPFIFTDKQLNMPQFQLSEQTDIPKRTSESLVYNPLLSVEHNEEKQATSLLLADLPSSTSESLLEDAQQIVSETIKVDAPIFDKTRNQSNENVANTPHENYFISDNLNEKMRSEKIISNKEDREVIEMEERIVPNIPTVYFDKSIVVDQELDAVDKAIILEYVCSVIDRQTNKFSVADRVAGSEEKTTVNVTVTDDQEQSYIVQVPVLQKYNKKYSATVSLVLLDGEVNVGQALQETDQFAVLQGISVPGIPEQTMVKEANHIGGTPDDPTVEVQLVYPDDSVTVVQVPVKQKDSKKYKPVVDAVAITGPANVDEILSEEDRQIVFRQVSLANVPINTTIKVANKIEGTQDNPTVPIDITYPDGTEDIVSVPLLKKNSELYKPLVSRALIDSSTEIGNVLNGIDRQMIVKHLVIPNAPKGTTITVSQTVVDDNGKPAVSATILYPDGTSSAVNIPVKQRDSAQYKPVVTQALINGEVLPNTFLSFSDKEIVSASVNVEGLPEGIQLTVADSTTYLLGNPVVMVTITYPDGTANAVDVPVKQKLSALYQPTVSRALISSATEIHSPINNTDKQLIISRIDVSTLPQDIRIVPEDVVSGEPSVPVVKVAIIYSDETQSIVSVPVKQKDSEQYSPIVTQVYLSEETMRLRTLSEVDKAVILSHVNTEAIPQNTTLIPGDSITEKEGKFVVPIIVSYPDATTKIVHVPVKEKPKDADLYTIKVNRRLIGGNSEIGAQLNNTDKEMIQLGFLEDNALPENTMIKTDDVIKDINNEATVELVILYPDASSKVCHVPIKQKDSEYYRLRADLALIDSQSVLNQTLTYADKESVMAAVDTDNLPKNINVTVDDKVSGTVDKPSVTVEVQYPDGTFSRVAVFIKQKDSKKYQPMITQALIDHDASVATPISEIDKDIIRQHIQFSEVMADITIVVSDFISIVNDMSVVSVVITYADLTTANVYVPVKQKDSKRYNPKVTRALIGGSTVAFSVLNYTDKVAIENSIELTGLPYGTTVNVSDSIESIENEPKVLVSILYPDGTTGIVDVPVKQKDSESYVIRANKALINGSVLLGSIVNNTDKTIIENQIDKASLPEQATFVVGNNVTESFGTPVVTVEVFYPDGTFDTVNVPVKQKDNEMYRTQNIGTALINGSTMINAAVNNTDKSIIKQQVSISGLPAGVSLNVGDIIVMSSNKPVVIVTLIYPDGTVENINVPVKQKDSQRYYPVIKAVTIQGATSPNQLISAYDREMILQTVRENYLPEGTTIKVSEVISGTQENPTCLLSLNYPDGTQNIVTIPIK